MRLAEGYQRLQGFPHGVSKAGSPLDSRAELRRSSSRPFSGAARVERHCEKPAEGKEARRWLVGKALDVKAGGSAFRIQCPRKVPHTVGIGDPSCREAQTDRSLRLTRWPASLAALLKSSLGRVSVSKTKVKRERKMCAHTRAHAHVHMHTRVHMHTHTQKQSQHPCCQC